MDGVSSVSVTSIAKDLLENDSDGIITETEIEEYVAKNEDSLAEMKLDKSDLIDELSDMFKSSETPEVEKTEDADLAADVKYEELKAKVAKYDSMLKEFGIRIDTLDTKIEDLTSKLEEANNEYDKLEQKLFEENEQLSSVADEIEESKSKLEKDTQSRLTRAVWKATSEYDPETDGDFEEYVAKQADPDNIYSPVTGVLSGLIKKQGNLSSALGGTYAKLQSQGSLIENLENELTATKADKASLESMKASTTTLRDDAKAEMKKIEDALKAERAALVGAGGVGEGPGNNGTKPVGTKVDDPDSIMNKIPECERKLAEEMGVNWSEKLADGTPRYIIAKGASVDEGDVYHIYDMSQTTSAGDNSLVRLKHGYDDTSFGMIPCGNGGITPGTFSYSESGQKEIYYFDDCQTMMKAGACYQTWSPLSLDLNGDGVKTSDKVVDFDIDGDGVVDKINDSADGVLVFDADGDGIVGEDGSETFGDNTDLSRFGITEKFDNGFDALRALADVAKKEGLIDGDDTLDADELSKMEERFGMKIKADGYTSEAQSLSDIGITEINLGDASKTSTTDNFDGKGNQLTRQEGATFKINGETREYADIWHRKYGENNQTTAGGSNIAFRTSQNLKKADAVLQESKIAKEHGKDSLKKDYHDLQKSLIKENESIGENKQNAYDKKLEKEEAKNKAQEEKEQTKEQEKVKENKNDKIEYMRYKYGSNK